jgi:ABC-type branched-subunit amino acid transport system permease subunit
MVSERAQSVISESRFFECLSAVLLGGRGDVLGACVALLNVYLSL